MANYKTGHVFIIAEIGSNHNQDIKQAFELMDTAKQSGADAVKFQSLRLEKLMTPADITAADIELFQKIELQEEWYGKIFEHARQIGIKCISAPTYLQALELLLEYGADIIKIASPQTYGFPELIKQAALSRVHTIMSTGYCGEKEIARAVKLYETYGDMQKLTLLHCTSQYPTETNNANLNYIKTLKETYGTTVGYSDHTLGITAPVAAVALGASVIEKHITLSRNMNGPDHYFALEPKEFKEMVSKIRQTETLLGSAEKKLTAFEKSFRDSVIMYPYSVRAIQKGEKITSDDITYYRSKTKGISPWEAEQKLLGTVLDESVPANHQFHEMEPNENERKNYKVY